VWHPFTARRWRSPRDHQIHRYHNSSSQLLMPAPPFSLGAPSRPAHFALSRPAPPHAVCFLKASRSTVVALLAVARPLWWAAPRPISRISSASMHRCSSAQPFNLYRTVALEPRARRRACAATTASDDDKLPPLPSYLVLLTSWACGELLLQLRALSFPLPPCCAGHVVAAPPGTPWPAFVVAKPSLGPQACKLSQLGLSWCGPGERREWVVSWKWFSLFLENVFCATLCLIHRKIFRDDKIMIIFVWAFHTMFYLEKIWNDEND
jgi:hypothetical protein